MRRLFWRGAASSAGNTPSMGEAMTAFAGMKGGEVLAHIRDVLLKIAADKRSFLEQSRRRSAGRLGHEDDELAEARALGAAADIVTVALSRRVQEAQARARCRPRAGSWVWRRRRASPLVRQ